MNYNLNDIVNVLSESTSNYINNMVIYTEGVVKRTKSKKYQDEKFKRYLHKYGYIQHPNPYRGMIAIDGIKVIVDTNPKNSSVRIDSQCGIGILYLTPEFQSIKDDRRKDSIINHEIGHYKQQRASQKKQNEEEIIKIFTQECDELKDKIPKKSERDARDQQNCEKYKKYEKVGTHSTIDEFKADAYAVQQKTGRHYKRALKEYTNNVNQNMDSVLERKFQEKIESIEKEYKELRDTEIKKQTQSLKDKINSGNISIEEKEKLEQQVKNIEKRITKKYQKLSEIDTTQLKQKHQRDIESGEMARRSKQSVETNNADFRRRSKALSDSNIDKSIYR